LKNTKSLSEPEKRYLGEIARTDDKIEQIVKTIKKLDLYDDTMIVVMGDHGELFSKNHDISWHYVYPTIYSHGETVYQEELAVPFLFINPIYKYFKSPRGKVKNLVQFLDFFPTIVDAFNLDDTQLNGKMGENLYAFSEKNSSFSFPEIEIEDVQYKRPSLKYIKTDFQEKLGARIIHDLSKTSSFGNSTIPEIKSFLNTLFPDGIFGRFIYSEGRMVEAIQNGNWKYIRRYPGFDMVSYGKPKLMTYIRQLAFKYSQQESVKETESKIAGPTKEKEIKEFDTGVWPEEFILKEELYHLASDPDEEKNIAKDKRKIVELFKILIKYYSYQRPFSVLRPFSKNKKIIKGIIHSPAGFYSITSLDNNSKLFLQAVNRTTFEFSFKNSHNSGLKIITYPSTTKLTLQESNIPIRIYYGQTVLPLNKTGKIFDKISDFNISYHPNPNNLELYELLGRQKKSDSTDYLALNGWWITRNQAEGSSLTVHWEDGFKGDEVMKALESWGYINRDD
jgi:hypothetical protein